MRILIVGNILKDVYLSLDERQNKVETDENGTPWMDVAFNGESHPFFSRTSVFGGAAVTLEVFKKLGIEASISGTDFQFEKELIPGADWMFLPRIACIIACPDIRSDSTIDRKNDAVRRSDVNL